MNDQERNDDKEFKQVVQHFLKTPPRPHKKAAAKKAKAKRGAEHGTAKAAPSRHQAK